MRTDNYRLKYILVGASGVGKTAMGHILEEKLGFRRCITFTTRPVRPGEVDGVDYHFRKELKPEEMFELSTFGEHQYGITHEELSKGDFIILEPQGVRYFQEHYPAPLTVIQLKRLNIQVEQERMDRDKAAGFDSVEADYVVFGDTVDTMATNLLVAISRSQQRQSLDSRIASAQQVSAHNSDADRSGDKIPSSGISGR